MFDRLKNGDPVIIAGVMGAIAALFYTRPLGLLNAVCRVIGGTSAAAFISPALASGVSTEFMSAVSFLIGLFSMTVVDIVFQIFARIRAAPIKTLGSIVNIVIDVLLAFRHGVDSRGRRKEGRENKGEEENGD